MAVDGTDSHEQSHSITNELGGVKNGDKEAPSRLVSLLEMKLRLLTRIENRLRRRCPEILRPRIDCEALVYQALQDFLSGVREGKFPDLGSRENVSKLLHKRAFDHLRTKIRDETREIRDPSREVRGEGLIGQLHQEAVSEDDLTEAPSDDEQRPLDPDELQRLIKAREILCGVDPMAMYVLEGLLGGRTIQRMAKSKGVGVGNIRNIIRQMIDALGEGERHERESAQS